ncbi:MAG: dicarboxylate/amino acid:cation symporter [Deltaproteobacteria bacterium]|nr:dicarboxylate/amino acid:cation symporter [Deltaproteobacteria bacterium]
MTAGTWQPFPWRWPLYVQTLVAMAVGAAIGLWLGNQVAPVAAIARWIVEVIKWLAVPLIFLAIFDAFVQQAFHAKGVAALFGVAIGNGLCAIAIGLGISNALHPGRWMDLRGADLAQMGAKSFRAPDASAAQALALMAQSPMVLAIVLAVVLGLVWLAARSGIPAGSAAQRVPDLAGRGLRLVTRALEWMVRLTPLAVFASVAKVFGEHGTRLVGGLLAYLLVCLGGMVLHVLVVYHGWVLGAARIGLGRFWRAARDPVVYAFGVNSSLATLPMTLKALDDIGVTPGAARLSACVGTNLNNDGILLYEVVAVLFLAQAFGVELSLPAQLLTAVICVAATVGVGGVPEAGIISLALVLGAVHLPVEAIPLLLSVDWLIARCRSVVNVLGDMAVAVAIDVVRGERRKSAASS